MVSSFQASLMASRRLKSSLGIPAARVLPQILTFHARRTPVAMCVAENLKPASTACERKEADSNERITLIFAAREAVFSRTWHSRACVTPSFVHDDHSEVSAGEEDLRQKEHTRAVVFSATDCSDDLAWRSVLEQESETRTTLPIQEGRSRASGSLPSRMHTPVRR